MLAQRGEVLAAIGGLDFAEQALERVEVLALDLERLDDRRRRGAAAAKSAEAAERGALLRLIASSSRGMPA